MDKKIYLDGKPDRDDRRPELVLLTKKARCLGPHILEFPDELDAALRQPFTKRDMATFERVLHKMGETNAEISANQ